MAQIQSGGNTASVANVDANYALAVNAPTVKANAGYLIPLVENDAGALFGSKKLRAFTSSEDNALQTGRTTDLFQYFFNSSAQDTGVWRVNVTTMTAVFATTGLQLNGTAIGTTGTGVTAGTYRHFNISQLNGTSFDFYINITAALLANQEYTLGWFFPTAGGITVPAEGVYLKLTTAGLIGYTNFNSSESNTTASLISAASFTPNVTYKLSICVYKDKVQFLLNDQLLAGGELTYPVGTSTPTAQNAFPLSIQSRNNGTVTGTIGTLKILNANVKNLDLDTGLDFASNQALKGLAGYQGFKGATQGSTALLTNNLAAGAGAAMTNTTAALGSGLGGQFSALPTLAIGTDGILCSYQNLSGAINISPRTLLIYGVKIQGAVTTVLAGNTTGTTYLYSIAYGHTAVSMATAEAAAAKAPRRIPIGYETYASAAAVGVLGAGTSISFKTPITVNPGEFVAICAKNLVSVTTTGVITFSVTFDSVWV